MYRNEKLLALLLQDLDYGQKAKKKSTSCRKACYVKIAWIVKK